MIPLRRPLLILIDAPFSSSLSRHFPGASLDALSDVGVRAAGVRRRYCPRCGNGGPSRHGQAPPTCRSHASSSTTVQILACGDSPVGGRMILNSSLIWSLPARVRRTVKTVLMRASRHRLTTN
jgi:hypothetical protein